MWCSSPPSWGLGETVVQGAVNPDEFYVYKPALRAGKQADRAAQSRRQGRQDGVRARRQRRRASRPSRCRRPTGSASASSDAGSRVARAPGAHHRAALRPADGHRMGQGWRQRRDLHSAGAARRRCRAAPAARIQRYTLKTRSTVLVDRPQHRPAHRRRTRRASSATSARWRACSPGDVLVAEMTDPDWEPVMKRAAAIVTNRGGRTCHAAIIARELGIPAVVGCGEATSAFATARRSPSRVPRAIPATYTRACSTIERQQIELDALPKIPRQDHDERRQSRPRLRLRHYAASRRRARAPGVHHQPHDRRASEGAARIRSARPSSCRRESARRWPATPIRSASTSTSSPRASRRSPQPLPRKPVIVRLSDFKSNEYANLIGGARYEPHEENPMLGFRGAVALCRRGLPTLLRARMPGAEAGARRHGTGATCRSWCRSCVRSRRRGRSPSCSLPTA